MSQESHESESARSVRPPTPRWVKVLAIIAVVLIALVAIKLIADGGEHGPGRHMGGASDVQQGSHPETFRALDLHR